MWTRTTPPRVVTLPVLQPTASPNSRAAARVLASRDVSRASVEDVAVNGILTASTIAAMMMTALRRLTAGRSGPAGTAGLAEEAVERHHDRAAPEDRGDVRQEEEERSECLIRLAGLECETDHAERGNE